ncbi:LysR family transcriptional regulator [uncultured Ilumatobacter sp.]|uniref:LysR family transcriptional regulator n=1 Tax=uncultured Ilumatobacter sp. TaxID=879968 RepID=UPI00374F4115
MKLDIESLRALKTVADTGSVNAAADLLCISRSAVSWKLKRMQERLGTNLLQKDGRGVVLTDSGHELLMFAETILTAHDAATRRFQAIDVSGTVRIGATEGASGPVLDVLAPWARRNTDDIDVRIRVDHPVALAGWLATGEIDLAVTMVLEPDVEPDDVLLWPDELVWAHSASGDFAHLERIPLVTFGHRCFFGAVAGELLTRADVPFDVVLENPSNYGVQMALASGAGIALINRRLLTDQHAEWEPPDSVAEAPGLRYVIRAASSEPSELVQMMLTQIRNSFTSASLRSASPLDVVTANDGTQLVGG